MGNVKLKPLCFFPVFICCHENWILHTSDVSTVCDRHTDIPFHPHSQRAIHFDRNYQKEEAASVSWQWTESAQIKQLSAWQQWQQWISVHQKLLNQSVARREKQNAYFTTSTATIRCGNPQTVVSFLVCHKYTVLVITYHEDTTEEHFHI